MRCKGLSARGRAYGPVRLWGSAAFILGTFVAGFATDTMPARHLIWLIVAASLLSALAALRAGAAIDRRPPLGEPHEPAQAACCAIPPSSRCWRRRA